MNKLTNNLWVWANVKRPSPDWGQFPHPGPGQSGQGFKPTVGYRKSEPYRTTCVTIYISHAPPPLPNLQSMHWFDNITQQQTQRNSCWHHVLHIAVADLHVDMHGVLQWSTDNHRLWPPICTNLQIRVKSIQGVQTCATHTVFVMQA